ncbi:FimB/Mfa2 family fimbrial subunit [uncultured Duncaniella sp.]|uniref:FimB/Mfa2 family fimbrial subunit n=1 Tax=uncultured Duncaniella sp. TaxID=2768039 RepID=UPI002649F563|nr:FimB/Mfa2 family fimbrial subunit [uncultured Duncaniella sp.]
MSRVLYKILVPVFVLLLCQACITEVDVGACNNTVIRFEYFGDGKDDVFADNVSSVTVCVYDSEGKLVTQVTIDKDSLKDFPGLKLRLPETGSYTVVAWGNLDDDCKLESQDKYTDGRVVVDGDNPDTFDKIFVGKIEFELDDLDGRKEMEIPFKSGHVTVNTYIQSSLDETPKYMVKMGEFASGISNSGDPVGPMRYYQTDFTTTPEGRHEAVTHLPRFSEDTDAVLEVYDTATGTLVASVKLAEYIAAHGIKLTGVEDAVIDVLIAISGTNISIKFPGWKPKPVYPSI